MFVIRLLPILIAASAFAQSVKVQNTGKIGRRVENHHYVAELPDVSGALSTLTYKDAGVTLQRVNSRINKTLMIAASARPTTRTRRSIGTPFRISAKNARTASTSPAARATCRPTPK